MSTMGCRMGVRDLTVRVGDATLLAEVDATLEPGAVTAIVGPNGAGKTTLLRVLGGLMDPTHGEVLIDETALGALSELERARRIAMIGHEAPPPFRWTVLELALMGRAPSLSLREFETEADIRIARDALRRVRLEELGDRQVDTLSAGERQRLMWARGLCQEPRVLLLDEPTSHQDPARAIELMSLLRELASVGCTVITVLHDLNLARRFAHQALILAEGRLVAHGPAAQTLVPERLSEVFGAPCRQVGEIIVFDPPGSTAATATS